MSSVVIVLFAGCNGENANSQSNRTRVSNDETRNAVSGETQIGGDSSKRNEQDQNVESNATEADLAESEVVTLDELKAEISRHKDMSEWRFVARDDGFPIGTWLSSDEGKSPLIFEKDGSFKCGFMWRKGQGVYAVGKYAISANGLIVAVAKHKGTRLGLFYKTENGAIFGSRGPRPRVEWKKVKSP
jgi:hypothetical protein